MVAPRDRAGKPPNLRKSPFEAGLSLLDFLNTRQVNSLSLDEVDVRH